MRAALTPLPFPPLPVCVDLCVENDEHRQALAALPRGLCVGSVELEAMRVGQFGDLTRFFGTLTRLVIVADENVFWREQYFLTRLTRLVELRVERCLYGPPPELSALTGLTSLGMSENFFTGQEEDWTVLGHLSRLARLELAWCQHPWELPAVLAAMPSLVDVDLFNSIDSQASLGNLPVGLRALCLHGCEVQEVRDGACGRAGLLLLCAVANFATSMPQMPHTITRLSSLTRLDLSHSEHDPTDDEPVQGLAISNYDRLRALTALQDLNLGAVEFRGPRHWVPAALTALTALTRLVLTDNWADDNNDDDDEPRVDLGVCLGVLTNLCHLDLRGNGVVELPNALTSVSSLTVLL